jgi:hypothetical protein
MEGEERDGAFRPRPKMNHGVVMFQGEGKPESRIWEMAMRRGQFVAIYTEKRMERAADGFASGLWSPALVPTTGGRLGLPRLPDLAGDYTEYARFEPSYDEQFFEMCRHCTGYSGAPTVVLPATAGDEEAMRLLVELQSAESGAWALLYERFYVVPRQNLRRRESSRVRLSHLMRSIHLNNQWAYFLGFFRSGDSVVVFLSDCESDVDGLFEPTNSGHPILRQADWLHDHSVIEKW